jgi:hypothetical protein
VTLSVIAPAPGSADQIARQLVKLKMNMLKKEKNQLK